MSEQLIPSLSALKQFSQFLSSSGVLHTLGGSGLIFAMGGSCNVNDWDLTLETTWDKLKSILQGMDYQYLKCDGNFATDFRCKVNYLDANFDLMNQFAIKASPEIYRMPLKVTGHWNGVPLGCPEEWATAYELMNRPEKVELIRGCIAKQKPAPEIEQEKLDALCAEKGPHCHSHH